MKKQVLFLGLCLCAAIGTAFAQQVCSDLFMSEYVEGTYNNKAIEIYNPTNQSVDLANYRLVRWNNGSNSYVAQAGQVLSGTIGPKEAFVFVLDKQDCSLTGSDTCVFQALKDKADAYICTNYDVSYALYHNGNDAISLHRVEGTAPGTMIDLIGVIGEDPDEDPAGGNSGGWNNVFPYTQSSGGAWWTRNQTMVRKATVQLGRSSSGEAYSGSWDPSAEWDTLGVDRFNQLGWHECACGNSPNGIESVLPEARITMFPNPAPRHTQFFVNAQTPIARVEVSNLSGQIVWQTNTDQLQVAVQLDDLPAGAYIVKTTLHGNFAPALDKIMVR